VAVETAVAHGDIVAQVQLLDFVFVHGFELVVGGFDVDVLGVGLFGSDAVFDETDDADALLVAGQPDVLVGERAEVLVGALELEHQVHVQLDLSVHLEVLVVHLLHLQRVEVDYLLVVLDDVVDAGVVSLVDALPNQVARVVVDIVQRQLYQQQRYRD